MHHSIDGEGRDTLHAQLVHDVLAMGDNGSQTDVQDVGNLLVGIALHDVRHHLYLTIGQNLLFQDLRHLGQVLALGMGMLLEGENGFDQQVLGLVDIEAVEVGQLAGVAERKGQDDGLVSALQKERTVAQHNFHGYEIMEIAVRVVAEKEP